jgi:hypothetical protein
MNIYEEERKSSHYFVSVILIVNMSHLHLQCSASVARRVFLPTKQSLVLAKRLLRTPALAGGARAVRSQ